MTDKEYDYYTEDDLDKLGYVIVNQYFPPDVKPITVMTPGGKFINILPADCIVKTLHHNSSFEYLPDGRFRQKKEDGEDPDS